MAGYFIATIHGVKDHESLRQYRRAATPTLQQYGGEVIATEINSQQFVEGGQSLGVVAIKFPSYDQARGWYNSPEYQKARRLRLGAVDIQAVISEGAG